MRTFRGLAGRRLVATAAVALEQLAHGAPDAPEKYMAANDLSRVYDLEHGRFQMRGLPPVDYYLVTVDPAEQGEWFEPSYLDQHRLAGARVVLGDGDIKTHDFRVSTR